MNKPPPNLEIPDKFKPLWRNAIWYFFVTLLVLWIWQEVFVSFAVRTIPYSQFKTHVAQKEVVEAAVKETEVVGRIVPAAARANQARSAPFAATQPQTSAPPPAVNGTSQVAGSAPAESQPFLFRSVRVEDPELVKELQAAGVKYSGVRPGVMGQLLVAWVLPIAIMIGLWRFIGRRIGATGDVLGIGKSRARLFVDQHTGVSFTDVAGCDEAKVELKEVVDFLKDPQQYKQLGARIPKGALLVGPPGTGKTLLARAVAGEAKVPFFSINGSDFVEMFVGVGAARVRDLFKQAKEQAPCIIFIDEIDAIGRTRGVHVGAVNDEREQTLNALLVEMDGFEINTGVIILAASNRPEVLDRALLRPGRFDRQIVVDAPDLDGREAILKVHARDKKLGAGVDLRRIAAATAGFSGADLANALNEAALLAGRRKAQAITQHDLEGAVEKVVAGPERKTRRLKEEEKRRVAYHEVGHALVAAYSLHSDPVHKISIVPRGRSTLGYTMQLPAEDQFLLTRSELLSRISGLLGGRAAEEVVFQEVSTGDAQNDLERATAMARQMVALYGMSERIGLTNCAHREPTFLAGPDHQFQRDCSEQTAREMDEEVKRLLDESYVEAKRILNKHRDHLELVSLELLEVETVDGPRFYELVDRVMPKVKEPVPPMAIAAAIGEPPRRANVTTHHV